MACRGAGLTGRSHDVVESHYRLLTEGLKVDHLRLVLGTSMGGMQTWIWGSVIRT